jgi:hypothetical protein
MKPPNMPGRCMGCCGCEVLGEGVTRDGLDGVVDGEAGDEYDREPRLPPLVARAHTDAVSSMRSATRDSPNMSTKALDRIVTSSAILARPVYISAARCLSSFFGILPVGFFGSALMNSIVSGTLYEAIASRHSPSRALRPSRLFIL